MNRRKKIIKLSKRGFSLIELLCGSYILLVVILGALLGFINCMSLIESNRNLMTAANDAQHALEEIKARTFTSIPAYISAYSSLKFTNLPQENITFPGPIYTSTLDTITVQITWNEKNATKTYSLITRIAQ